MILIKYYIRIHANDDKETAAFDRTVLIMMADNGGQRLSCPSEPVSVYDWFKHDFVTHEVNAEAACAPY